MSGLAQMFGSAAWNACRTPHPEPGSAFAGKRHHRASRLAANNGALAQALARPRSALYPDSQQGWRNPCQLVGQEGMNIIEIASKNWVRSAKNASSHSRHVYNLRRYRIYTSGERVLPRKFPANRDFNRESWNLIPGLRDPRMKYTRASDAVTSVYRVIKPKSVQQGTIHWSALAVRICSFGVHCTHASAAGPVASESPDIDLPAPEASRFATEQMQTPAPANVSRGTLIEFHLSR